MSRFFEILPGALAWLTLILVVVLSSQAPAFVAVFIILFDIYWLLKSLYLSFHLRSTFGEMRKNLEVNWLAKLREEKESVGTEWEEIRHLIILPMFEEPYELVRESFGSIADSNYPKDKMVVVLATEERAYTRESGVGSGEWGVAETARRIQAEFGNEFLRLLVTVHPAGLPGELAGKGSNETWAAKEAKRLVIDPLLARSQKSELHPNALNYSENSDAFAASDRLSYDKILVSVFDVDTQVYPEYFGRLTYVFLRSEDRLRAVYQPIPLFVNNIFQAPALARIVAFTTSFWQMMQQSRPERLTTFSSQSVPFPVLKDIGFWHTDVVSEDSRIFWQGFLRYHGEFRVEPLFYPVSMDANVTPRFWQTMKNLYKQHRRWGWGAENIPYMMCGKRSEKSEFHPNAPKAETRQIVEKELSYKLTGIFFKIQKELGRFARERQYGDALALELEKNGLKFERERSLEVGGRKSNLIDFVIENKVAVELKAKPFVTKEDYYQTQRYLQSSNLELGLIVNFAQPFLKPKRVLNVDMHVSNENSDHSDVFADSDRVEGFLYDKRIPLRKKLYWGFHTIEGFHSWATNALMIFALGWLPIWIGGDAFNDTLLSYNLPRLTSWIIDISMIGIATSAIVSILLLPPKPEWFRPRHYLLYLLQWALLPVTLIIFGALPGLEAQTRLMLGGRWRLGFWVTPKHRE